MAELETGPSMSDTGWDPHRLPAADGRVFAVTGASSGIGFWAACQLAATGARVLLLCRDRDRADRAVTAIRDRVTGAEVEAPVLLDLAELVSVRAAAEHLATLDRLDGLVNNAGRVSISGARRSNSDGVELTIATNALGPFLLTRLVLPVLAASGSAATPSRVVTMGSMAARMTRIRRADLALQRGGSAWQAYGQSKALGQAFGFELQRRLTASGETRVISTGAHPGYAIDALDPDGRPGGTVSAGVVTRIESLFAQSKWAGAWPLVRALLDPTAYGGEWYGPRWAMRGVPILTGGLHRRPHGIGAPASPTLDPTVGRLAWDWASTATGVDDQL